MADILELRQLTKSYPGVAALKPFNLGFRRGEPTRGIDAGAKQEIYALMRRLSDRGAAIIVISSEMPELLGMSDRILVLPEGRVVGELSKDQFDQERVLRLASGLQLRGEAA